MGLFALNRKEYDEYYKNGYKSGIKKEISDKPKSGRRLAAWNEGWDNGCMERRIETFVSNS